MNALVQLRVFGNMLVRSTRLSQRHSLRQVHTHSYTSVQRSWEVEAAVKENRGIVALESTIVAHGMPYPQNLETAQQVEQIVRNQGSCPATIGILDGQIKVGMTDIELHQLAKTGAARFGKASRRDIAAAVAWKGNAATTVASTALIASDLANIDVFVTGGIGGVHRGVADTMDVSADLTEIARTPITIVCAGAKSILDIPRTLEYLETQGVPVVGFQTDEFPAFFSRHSGCKVSHSVDKIEDIVSMIATNKALDIRSGIVVAVPIPEEYATSGAEIEEAIQQALREADENTVLGKEITPFVLRRVNEITGGASLAANVALVKNNAVVGAEIARQLAELNATSRLSSSSTVKLPSMHEDSTKDISRFSGYGAAVIGGAVLDIIASPSGTDSDFVKGTSNPTSKVNSTVGGVAKNIALSFSRCTERLPPLLVSAIGDDVEAQAIMSGCKSDGLITDGLQIVAGAKSGLYLGFHNCKGNLLYGVARMDIFEGLSFSDIKKLLGPSLEKVPIIICDGNLTPSTLSDLANFCAMYEIQMWFEPTSEAKATRIVQAGAAALQAVTFCSPNLSELIKISEEITGSTDPLHLDGELDQLKPDEAVLLAKYHIDVLGEAGVQNCVTTLGAAGVVCGGKSWDDHRVFPSKHINSKDIVNTNGAGDSFVGACAAAVVSGQSLIEGIELGLHAAKMSCLSGDAVSPHLSVSSCFRSSQ